MKKETGILLVDDEPPHRMLAKRALRRAFPNAVIHEGASLDDTLRVLNNPGTSLCLAIVDLNLQGKSGIEVLKALRADTRYTNLPIIINSTSQLESDFQSAYAHGASAYIFKSDQPEQFGAELGSAVQFLTRE